MSGTLRDISADSLIDEVSGQPYFDATVVLVAEDLGFLELRLVPGMPADVSLKQAPGHLWDHILPSKGSFENSLTENKSVTQTIKHGNPKDSKI